MIIPDNLPSSMHGVQLLGHGGFDKLVYRKDLPVPLPDVGDVLIQVAAAGVNNTDINPRTGWYSKSMTADTKAGGVDGFAMVDDAEASWMGGSLKFPRIQGADICGRIIGVGTSVDPARIGERVLVQTMQPLRDAEQITCMTIGSEYDGGFAQYAVAKSEFTFAVNCDWSDAELATIPCAYSTAENMLERAKVRMETILITGASGGVGSAAAQLAKRCGAIAGPIVELDVRTLYLKDLTLLGATYQDDEVFPNLVSYIEDGEICPTLAATYQLSDIERAQEDFLSKKYIGKLVLIPPKIGDKK